MSENNQTPQSYADKWKDAAAQKREGLQPRDVDAKKQERKESWAKKRQGWKEGWDKGTKFVKEGMASAKDKAGEVGDWMLGAPEMAMNQVDSANVWVRERAADAAQWCDRANDSIGDAWDGFANKHIGGVEAKVQEARAAGNERKAARANKKAEKFADKKENGQKALKFALEQAKKLVASLEGQLEGKEEALQEKVDSYGQSKEEMDNQAAALKKDATKRKKGVKSVVGFRKFISGAVRPTRN